MWLGPACLCRLTGGTGGKFHWQIGGYRTVSCSDLLSVEALCVLLQGYAHAPIYNLRLFAYSLIFTNE